MSRLSSAVTVKRAPLALWLRAAVVLLAVLQIVAPSWHVCALGGHCATSGHHKAAGHHEEYAEGSSNTPLKPLICACASKPKPPISGNAWNPVEKSDPDPFCLALLLQTMPGAKATVAPLLVQVTSVTAVYRPFQVTVFRHAPAHSTARGPPLLFL